jgi:signal transduction histidine kinase
MRSLGCCSGGRRASIEASRAGRIEGVEVASRFIVDSTSRMAQLLSDLLAYTQLVIEGHETDAPSVDLNLVVDRTLGNLSALIQLKGAACARWTDGRPLDALSDR